jgi:Cu-processing system permease protein
MQTNVIYSIAKKEIMDNIRNKWIILVSAMFALLTLVVSYFGSLASRGWQDLGVTISGMASLVTFLVPIIALMLAYATIIGEIERGSMNSLLSLSATRFEIIIGKFLGLAGVLCFTIIIGFGAAGLMIAANVSNVNYADYGIFIGATMLLGLVFLSVALFFSTLFNKRSTAMGGAIFLWFLFNIILPIVFIGLLATSIDITEFALGNPIVVPDWYHALNLFNPTSVYSSLLTTAIGPVSSMNASSMIPAPSWYSSGLLIGVLLAWVIVFFVLAVWRFQRKDI